MARKPPPPCDPGKHRFRAHEHVSMPDGAVKPCGGRFWCLKCLTWHSAKPCRETGMLRLPAGWLKA